MTTTREAILQRLRQLVQADPFFPDDVEVDVPEPTDWRPIGEGSRLEHTAAVQDGPTTVLREACGEGDTYEMQLEAAVAYVVAGVDDDGGNAGRRARRDEAGPRLWAAIEADRSLGLDVEVYAQADPLERDDQQLIRAGEPCASAVLPLRITYTAATPVD